ncbi:hypothetical protein GCM10022244_35630 [Streptomyces gulbargensis]|uniref:Uncharacterized protein n=1 Tax=Streptomyces gulbargensis TaxID=364901 RepID=A0ABP7MKA0_9ACTN
MSGRVSTRLHPEPSCVAGPAYFLGPPLLPREWAGYEFRSVAGFGGPTGVTVTLDEGGRREQAVLFRRHSPPPFSAGIPVTLRGARTRDPPFPQGNCSGRAATIRHFYDPAHAR